MINFITSSWIYILDKLKYFGSRGFLVFIVNANTIELLYICFIKNRESYKVVGYLLKFCGLYFAKAHKFKGIYFSLI